MQPVIRVQCALVVVAFACYIAYRRSVVRAWVGPSGYGYSTPASEIAAPFDLTGSHFLVTGANSGLGYETARVLASRGADVTLAARTVAKAEAAIASISEAVGVSAGNLKALECDLSSLRSVDAAAEHFVSWSLPLDGLILNAGIMALPARAETEDGIEKQAPPARGASA